MRVIQGTREEGYAAFLAGLSKEEPMADPNHGNSIITRLRLIIEDMAKLNISRPDVMGLLVRAESLLPLADVDDIEVIVLREAAAIINGRGMPYISNLVESVADEVAAEMVAEAGR